MAENKKKLGTLPHWDMTPIFPSLESKEFSSAFESLIAEIGNLKSLFDAYDIRKDGASLTDESIVRFDELIGEQNNLSDAARLVSSFIYSFVTTDSRNNLAQAKLSELQMHAVELQKLSVRQRGWLGTIDVEKLIQKSSLAAEHAFSLRKAAESAAKLMTEAEEDLAASLSPAAIASWAKLHGNVSSQLKVKVDLPDGEKELPMSAVRGLAHDPDPAVRETAYRAELEGWEAVAVPLAASLNSIKGWGNVLNERRGWKDSLEPALFENNVDRETLEAMQEACVASFPDFRRYLKAKARVLGKDRLAFWDLFAPVGGGVAKIWPYSEATEFIVDNFSFYSPRLGDLAARAFRENWIDAEPRDGKRDGAFCMGVRSEESRVLANYEGSFDSVHTLAHELGHAYHNVNLAQRTPLQRNTPMALAETASIFCQTIVTNAALAEAKDEEKLSILEQDVQDACQVVVDIHSRFLFEKGVFEGRETRELSVDELNELMVDAQRQTYGDGLDPEALHKFMWAAKTHYYGSSYYNWPYTFGLLFGLGLYAQYRQDPEGFRASYDELLASTGSADAAALTGRFGMDIRSVDFWTSSLDIVRERIKEYESLS